MSKIYLPKEPEVIDFETLTEREKEIYKADYPNLKIPKWKPGIHMPKEACRIFLKVTEVKVESLQDISQEDAKAEGVLRVDLFRDLWKSINGPESWESNPWVWVISFERIKKPENFK